MFNKLTSKNIRILVGKPGLDGHDRGALILCKALMKSGMEVIYSGLKITPNNIVKMAIEEDVDAIALSLLNGAHMTIFTKISQMLKEKNIKTFKTNLLIFWMSFPYLTSMSLRTSTKSSEMSCIKYIPLGYDDASQMAV